MSAGEAKSGQCLCGAVMFTATPKDSNVGVCHCETCRRGTAGAFFTVDCGDQFEITKSDGLKVYNSSEWAERAFCGECGTPIVWRTKDHKANVVSVNAINDMTGLKLDHEVFIDEKPDYYSFSEDTQQLTGAQVFAMFAGDK